MIDAGDGYTPTPVISHAILAYNRGRTEGLADGVVLTPSHNPPEDGGFKYNPPTGGPADFDRYRLDRGDSQPIARNRGSGRAAASPMSARGVRRCVRRHDYIGHYVGDLASVIDMEAIEESGLSLGVDPLGGASVAYWAEIIERYGLNGEVVEDKVDPTFGFMTADWDGKIRMDCSSPYAMTRLIGLRDRFDLAIGNDTDADSHGIVTPTSGLMKPNHYLAAAISYLFDHRPAWAAAMRHRQDDGEQRDDRPHGGAPRPQARRSPGRVQMVRRRAVYGRARLCRRGERRRIPAAPRRIGLDHRQGRPCAWPAGSRDQGPVGPRSRPDL